MTTPGRQLVDELEELLRSFVLRLGENTAGFIIDGRRTIQLSGGERRWLAESMAPLVDGVVERRCSAVAGDLLVAELVAATRDYAAAHDPHVEIQEELAAAWASADRLLPEGPEKARLRQAVVAAGELLNPRKDDREGASSA